MPKLKFSLIKDGIFSIPCSTVFIKHIEGMMCQAELHLNKMVDGRLETFYQAYEKNEDNKRSTEGKFPFDNLHIINFHKKDLPFTNLSVDKYARRFFKFALADPNAVKIATTIHGPGAGLDPSESLEIMLQALAEELSFTNSLGSLQEILFIERNPDTYEMLRRRLNYLEADKVLIEFEGDDFFLLPAPKGTTRNLKDRSNQLTKSIFVAMPFSDDFDDIYWYGIKQPIEKVNCKPELLKHEKFIGVIIDRIKRRIKESKLVIADISGNNPNVFYEVGYAQALDKPVILISQQEETAFDLSTHRHILYSSKRISFLEKELSEHLTEILQTDR